MVHSVSRWTWGVQVKLWDPLRTHAIPQRCVHDKALYSIQIHVYLYFCLYLLELSRYFLQSSADIININYWLFTLVKIYNCSLKHRKRFLYGSQNISGITCICEACKSIVIMWSAPAVDNMFAINFAEIGARLCNKKYNIGTQISNNNYTATHGQWRSAGILNFSWWKCPQRI